MRKQKKFFLSWVLGFLLLILFFPQNNLLAEDADETVNSSTGEIVDDDDNIAGSACESTTSEGLDGGFLFFEGSVVPCGRSCDVAETEEDESASCTLCHFILLAKNIYDLLFAMVIFASILMITIGGTIYMISSGRRNLAETGKALITKTLAGFALFILGELIVITVLNFVGANLGVINESGSFFKFTCDTESAFDKESSSSGGGSGGGTGSGTGTGAGSEIPSGDPTVAKTIPKSCDAYKNSFKAASGGDETLACLLVGIAAKEGGGNCDPVATSPSNPPSCGLMQIQEGTVNGKDCDYLNKHPEETISMASERLNEYRGILSGYSGTFDIGNSNSQSGKTVEYGSHSFDTGSDDLIASYNAGVGNGTNPDGTRQSFYVSKDCKTTPATPAWQCNINPSGFAETQNYVPGVQSYQKGCLEKGYFGS